MNAAILGFVEGFAKKRTEMIEKEREKRDNLSSLLRKMHLKGIEKQRELYAEKEKGWNTVSSALDSGDLQAARLAAAKVGGFIESAQDLKKAGADVDFEATINKWDEDTLRGYVDKFKSIRKPDYDLEDDYFPAYISKERELFDGMVGKLFGVEAKKEYVPSSTYGLKMFSPEQLKTLAAADEDERKDLMESFASSAEKEIEFPTVTTSPVFEADEEKKYKPELLNLRRPDGSIAPTPVRITESGDVEANFAGGWQSVKPKDLLEAKPIEITMTKMEEEVASNIFASRINSMKSQKETLAKGSEERQVYDFILDTVARNEDDPKLIESVLLERIARKRQEQPYEDISTHINSSFDELIDNFNFIASYEKGFFGGIESASILPRTFVVQDENGKTNDVAWYRMKDILTGVEKPDGSLMKFEILGSY